MTLQERQELVRRYALLSGLTRAAQGYAEYCVAQYGFLAACRFVRAVRQLSELLPREFLAR